MARLAAGKRALPRLRTDDSDVNRAFDGVSQALQGLATNVLVNGRLVRRVSLVAGRNLVSHGLGRGYLTWIACAPSTASVLTDAGSSANPDTSTYLAISATVACTVDLVVL